MEITGGQVRLVDLVGPDGAIRNLHAREVQFLGPAIIVPAGNVTQNGCYWDHAGGGIDAIVWEIDSARTSVLGAIEVTDSVFESCRFLAVGFAGNRATVQGFLEATSAG